MGVLPLWDTDLSQGGPDRLWVSAGGGPRTGWGCLVERQLMSCQLRTCSRSMPFMLPFEFPTIGMCLSQTERHGYVRYGRSHSKTQHVALQAVALWFQDPIFFLSCSSEVTLNYLKPGEMCSCSALLTMQGFPLQVGFK